MVVRLSTPILDAYERFSRYNSPYPAHDRGCAIDWYPDTEDGIARSPISGTVLETRTVRAPSKPYAPAHDHLLVLACEDDGVSWESEQVAGEEPLHCRILHVDPVVEPGDQVTRGDPLGTLVRAGFFAPWVDRHLHVGFRPADRNSHRASGSLPLAVDVDITPVEWDGRGIIRQTDETSAILDIPSWSGIGLDERAWAGIGTDTGGVLDGGLPHYDGGGLVGSTDGPVALLGTRVGTATDGTVSWDSIVVTVDGEPVRGLSLFCSRAAAASVKVICPDQSFAVGQSVQVELRPR